MAVLRSFLKLPVKERQTLVTSFSLLIIIRMGLWILPFSTLQRTLRRSFRSPVTFRKAALSPEETSWAVSAAGRYVPAATCLAQALTLQALLSRQGIHSDLVIGVAHHNGSRILAHAWLEIDGRVIIGERERDNYTRLEGRNESKI